MNYLTGRAAAGATLAACYRNAEAGCLEMRALWPVRGEKPSESAWFLADEKDEREAALDWAFERNRKGYDLFFGPNPRCRGGLNDADVMRCLSVWIDRDKLPWEDAIYFADDLDHWVLRPNLMVFSGGGVHAYWVLSEEIDPASPEVRLYRQALLGAAEQFDSDRVVTNLSRVMRLPGTRSHKRGQDTGCWFNEGMRAVHLDEFLEFVPEVSVRDEALPGSPRDTPGRALMPQAIEAIVGWLKGYWQEGGRHMLALTLAGIFCYERIRQSDCELLIQHVATAAGDNEIADRLQAVRGTYRRWAAGAPTRGWAEARGSWNPVHVQSLQDWLKDEAVQLPPAAPAPAAEWIDPTTGEIHDSPPAAPAPAPARLLTVYRGGELSQMDVAKPVWIWDGLVPAQSLTILAGDPKAGKSLLAANLCLAVATGRPMHNRPCAAAPVLYLNYEDYLGLTRYRLMTMAGGTIPDGVMVATDPRRSWLEYEHELRDLIKSEGVRLLVLDPLLRAARVQDENDNAQMERAVRPLQILAEDTGCAVLLVHHTQKVTGQGGKAIRGASSIFGACQGAVLLRREIGTPAATIEATGKFGPGVTYSVVLQQERMLWESPEALAEAFAEQRRQKIAAALQQRGTAYAHEIAQALGLNRHVIEQDLGTLALAGHCLLLHDEQHGMRARWAA